MAQRHAACALAALVVLVGCSVSEPGEGGGYASVPPGASLTRDEALRGMAQVACEKGFRAYGDLPGSPLDCAAFILRIRPDGGIDPEIYQVAQEQALEEIADQAVEAAWDQTWSVWLSGAALVCRRTTAKTLSSAERDELLDVLEGETPGLSQRIYAEALAMFCPATTDPNPEPLRRSALEMLCSTPVGDLPDLIDASDSAYWTEVVQTLAASEGIPVGPIDGQYGPQTIAGVQALQRRVGVIDDGQVGPITWSALQRYFC